MIRDSAYQFILWFTPFRKYVMDDYPQGSYAPQKLDRVYFFVSIFEVQLPHICDMAFAKRSIYAKYDVRVRRG
jgi:hypothetical protein